MATGTGSEGRSSKNLSIFDRIKKALDVLTFGKSVYTQSDGTHCVECKQELDRDHKGYQFCSQFCAANYWENFRQKHDTSTKAKVCKLPGCTKPGYIEPNGHVHDFCGRTHANEYHDLTGEIDKEKMVQSRLKRFSKNSSGEAGTSYAATAASGGLSHTRSGAVYGSTVSSQQGQFTDSHWRDNDTRPIRFYDRDALYYEFTNFYPVSIHLDDKDWPTTEHYFQAQKFVGTPFVEMIRRCTFPREAFDLSRNPTVSRWRRKDWDEVKIDVMRKALLAKFTQHERLRQRLLNTGRRHLIEHTRHDSFWGDGGNGTGQNHLGRLLMEIRDGLLDSKGDSGASCEKFQNETFQTSTSGKECQYKDAPHSSVLVTGGGGDLTRRPLRQNCVVCTGHSLTMKPKNEVRVSYDLADVSIPTAEHRPAPTHRVDLYSTTRGTSTVTRYIAPSVVYTKDGASFSKDLYYHQT